MMTRKLRLLCLAKTIPYYHVPMYVISQLIDKILAVRHYMISMLHNSWIANKNHSMYFICNGTPPRSKWLRGMLITDATLAPLFLMLKLPNGSCIKLPRPRYVFTK